MINRNMTLPTVAALALALAACGKSGEDTGQADTSTAKATDKPAPAALPRTPAPEGARAFIIEPVDGATVTSPAKVVFGAENIEVAPAGNDVPDSGHHHLIIDAPLPDFSQPVPSTEQYVHFGGGQTETTVELEPGEHELRLLFGDHLHIPHDPPVYSEIVTITVE